MAFETEILSTPSPLPVVYQYDRDRGRVLMRIRSGSLRVRFRTPYVDKPNLGEFSYLTATLEDQYGNTQQIYRENINDRRDIREWLSQKSWFVNAPNEVRERAYSFGFEDTILSQYDDASYSDIRPGPATITFQFNNKPPASIETFIPVKWNAAVRENTSLTNLSVRRDGFEIQADATVEVWATHGVSIPVVAKVVSGGDTITSVENELDTAGSVDGGPVERTVQTTTLRIPPQIYSEDVELVLEPVGWASAWMDAVSDQIPTGDLSPGAVEITDCTIAPQQVTVPEEVTLTATVSNPTPGDVDADVRFVLAGEETFTKQPVRANSERTFETTYATSEPGEATGEVFLDDVVPL